MIEIAQALPQDVLDFVAECRAKSYSLEAEPNYNTRNSYESGFRFQQEGLVFVDVSTEQDGRFSGEEYVAIRASFNPGLNGRKFYKIQYTGADEPHAQEVGSKIVAQVQHGLVIEHPTAVRFGSSHVCLRPRVAGKKFLYIEKAMVFPWGRTNHETLSEDFGALNLYAAVYKGAHQFTIFGVK